jgi:hypothetical protein
MEDGDGVIITSEVVVGDVLVLTRARILGEEG